MENTEPKAPSTCLNCETVLSPEAQFCENCGQRRTTGRVRLRQFLVDAFDTLFNLDSRTFVTLRHIFTPGLLTQAYFQGRHKTYLPPFRLFLITLVALIALTSWLLDANISKNGDLLARVAKVRAEYNLMNDVDSLRQDYLQTASPNALTNQLDSLKTALYRRNRVKGDSIDLDNLITISSNEDFPPIKISDFFELDADELIDKYQIEGFTSRFIFRQKVKIIRDSRTFLRFLIGRISWMFIILMPILALILKLMYYRRNYYFVEHFIFSIHLHTVFFALAALQLALVHVIPVWTISINVILFAVYLWKAMRRFYQQGWWKTSIKFSLLTIFLYWIGWMGSLFLAMVLGILLF